MDSLLEGKPHSLAYMLYVWSFQEFSDDEGGRKFTKLWRTLIERV
jgi:hypothetical protein